MIHEPERRDDDVRAWLAIAAIVLAIPLAVHAYAGLFSRYMGDDYCSAILFRREGLLGAQRYYYDHMNAVPTTIVLMALTDWSGPALPWLAAAVLTAWVACLAWAIAPVTRWIAAPAPRLLALAVALAVVFGTTEDAPNIVQSLYLRIPTFGGTLPLAAFAALTGFCLRSAERGLGGHARLAGVALAAFAIGGASAVYSAVQTTAIAMAGLALLAWERTPRRAVAARLAAAALIGSIAALAVIAAAPGNAVRQSHFPAPPPWPDVMRQTIDYTLAMFARPLFSLHGPIERWLPGAHDPAAADLLSMRTSRLVVLVVAGAGAAAAWIAGPSALRRETVARLLVWTPVTAALLVAAAMAVGVYGIAAPPPDRALIVPTFTIDVCLPISSFAATSYLLARHPRIGSSRVARRTAATAFIGLIAVAAAVSTARTFSRAATMRDWAAAWSDVDRSLRGAAARGARNATVRAIPLPGGLEWLNRSADHWVNLCVAEYYRLDSVIGAVR